MENMVEGLIGLFNGLGKEVVVFIISMLPFLELRGGLLAAALLDLNFWTGYVVSIIGNTLPIPIVLLFLEKVLGWLESIKFTKGFVGKIEKKILSKRDQIEKYGYVGLMIFVGIPLPGTGAWTGAGLAVLLGMDKKKSFVYIMLGVILASIIMSIVSYGILGNLIH